MASKLERLISDSAMRQDDTRAMLVAHLDAPALRTLRGLSRSLRIFADGYRDIAYRDIYINVPLLPKETLSNMHLVSQHCQNLTFKVAIRKEIALEPDPTSPKKGKKSKRLSTFTKKVFNNALDRILPPLPPPSEEKENPPTPHPELQDMDIRMWTSILSNFTSLQTCNLRIAGDPAWPGRTQIEETLLLLRVTLERSRPRHLHTLSLSPVHAMGIIHLRWANFGAFHTTPSQKETRLWTNLRTLDLRIKNPKLNIDEVKYTMFFKLLYEYLRSFSPTLQILKFVWMDGEGPSPMALEDEPGLMETSARRPISWPRLEEFWFGNITFPNRTTSLIPDCAPRCRIVKALRSTHRFSRIDNQSMEPSWYDVPMERMHARRNMASLAASSIYSQVGGPGGEFNGSGNGMESRVSSTSRVVPFMLDTAGQGETLSPTRYDKSDRP